MSETKCSNHGSSCASERSPDTRRRVVAMVFALLLAVTVGLVAFVEVNTWRQLDRLKGDFAGANLESFYLGVDLREALLRMNATLFRFQLSDDDEERERFYQDAQELTARIERTQASLTTAAERQLLERVRQTYERYLADSSELLIRGLRGIRKDTAAKLHDQLSAQTDPLLALADQLVQAQHIALDRFFDSSGAALGSLQWTLVISLLLFGALVCSVAALMYRAFITPLRMKLSQSQALLERHEKLAALGVLAAGVAHEVRNPLTAIKFRLFSLKKALPTACADNEDVVVINSEINRLERIVRDFLQFARPSEPDLKPVTAEGLLAEVRDLLQPELERRLIELKLEVDNAVLLQADRQQLQQVLINLVQNAADSIGRDGAITLSAREDPASTVPAARTAVVLEVRDTGRGIPPEVEKRIFDPFFSTKDGGTGLGLSIAARIVEKHGGFIQYSTQMNRGTQFSLVLPKPMPDESQNSPD